MTKTRNLGQHDNQNSLGFKNSLKEKLKRKKSPPPPQPPLTKSTKLYYDVNINR
jgi:hypothetical protein